jgi:hypothetical protein
LNRLKLEELIERLKSDLGYSNQGAELVANKLNNLVPEIRSAFEYWWKTGEFSEITIEGYSLEVLMTQHRMNATAAFLTLDWLVREPDQAKASLRRGHDFIDGS